MRFLSLVLLCVAVTSALSPFNLAARQETVITTETETNYFTQTPVATTTITSLVITTSIDDIITLNNCTVLLVENFYTLPVSVSYYYETEYATFTVIEDVTVDPLTSTLDEFFTSTIPASTITETATITAPAPITTLVLTSWVTSTLTETEDIVQDFITSVITTVSTTDVVQTVTSTSVTDVTIFHTTSTSTFTTTVPQYSIVYVTDYSYSTTATCGPTPTSTGPAPGVTVTRYDDFQCSLAGNSTVLSTTKQSSWPACLQQGTSILGESHGIISWGYYTQECDVVRGYGTVSKLFNPIYYCATVQYTAIQVFCNQDFARSYNSIGNFIVLDESIQPTWDYCLQHAVAYLNGSQGWVSYASDIVQEHFCNVFGNATAGTAVEGYERMYWDYAAIGFSDIPSSPDLYCAPPPGPAIPAICPDAADRGGAYNFGNATIEPWCNFQCVGYSATGGVGLGVLDYSLCLLVAGQRAVLEQLLTSYVSWSTTTNACDLLLNTESLPNAPGAIGNSSAVCAIVTNTLPPDPDCTSAYFNPTSDSDVGWEILCGFQCELDGSTGAYVSYGYTSWKECLAHTNDVSDNPYGVVINWNRVTNQCMLSKPRTNAVLRRQYNPYSDCAVYVTGIYGLGDVVSGFQDG
jgi:hypothetical protein